MVFAVYIVILSVVLVVLYVHVYVADVESVQRYLFCILRQIHIT